MNMNIRSLFLEHVAQTSYSPMLGFLIDIEYILIKKDVKEVKIRIYNKYIKFLFKKLIYFIVFINYKDLAKIFFNV